MGCSHSSPPLESTARDLNSSNDVQQVQKNGQKKTKTKDEKSSSEQSKSKTLSAYKPERSETVGPPANIGFALDAENSMSAASQSKPSPHLAKLQIGESEPKAELDRDKFTGMPETAKPVRATTGIDDLSQSVSDSQLLELLLNHRLPATLKDYLGKLNIFKPTELDQLTDSQLLQIKKQLKPIEYKRFARAIQDVNPDFRIDAPTTAGIDDNTSGLGNRVEENSESSEFDTGNFLASLVNILENAEKEFSTETLQLQQAEVEKSLKLLNVQLCKSYLGHRVSSDKDVKDTTAKVKLGLENAKREHVDRLKRLRKLIREREGGSVKIIDERVFKGNGGGSARSNILIDLDRNGPKNRLFIRSKKKFHEIKTPPPPENDGEESDSMSRESVSRRTVTHDSFSVGDTLTRNSLSAEAVIRDSASVTRGSASAARDSASVTRNSFQVKEAAAATAQDRDRNGHIDRTGNWDREKDWDSVSRNSATRESISQGAFSSDSRTRESPRQRSREKDSDRDSVRQASITRETISQSSSPRDSSTRDSLRRSTSVGGSSAGLGSPSADSDAGEEGGLIFTDVGEDIGNDFVDDYDSRQSSSPLPKPPQPIQHSRSKRSS